MSENVCANLKYILLLPVVIWLGSCAGAHHSGHPETAGQVSRTDREAQAERSKIARLQNDLAALNTRADAAEAGQVARTAIGYSYYLAEKYEVVRPAVFHNILVRVGLKDRGLCHHWTADLMVQLEQLALKSYQLFWGVAYRGSELREHNSVVIAARGQRFEEGIVLDPWRDSGELHWAPVKRDHYPWQERPRSEWY
jgi:hypothetical protein